MKKPLLLLFLIFISQISFGQIPTNNTVANATEITAFPLIENNIRIDLSNNSTGGQNGCSLSNYKIIYYKFTATQNTQVTVTLADSNSGTLGNNFIIFYTAPDLNVTNENQLTLFSDCSYSDGSNVVSVNQGTNYYVLVHRENVNTETNINFSVPIPVSQIEKDALIALYNSTDGPNWTDNTNWLSTEPVSSWSGVTVENGHVTAINKFSSNLTGMLPVELQNLTFLETFRVHENNLYGLIPDLTGITTLNYVNINRNDFHFGDFENELLTYINNIPYFYYSPMNKVETEIIYDLTVGDTYTLTMPSISGTGVTYQWFKNDEPIAGETGLTYTITNAQVEDAANYYCKASSPIVTNLTIDRETIHIYSEILASDRNALVIFYYATGGVNWTNSTNWNTSAPVHEWFGVTVVGNRVTNITLSGNNLVGTLPTEIGDLTKLKSISLYNNQLSGSIPADIGNLVELVSLSIPYNQLSGSIPIEIGNLINLDFLNLLSNDLSGTIPAELGNCISLTTLSLEDNQLTGNIPTSFANLTAMQSFWLNGNQLSGSIPDVFSNWINLQYLSIGDINNTGSHNNFTGALDLSSNALLNLCWLDNNDISDLTINNGNNTSIYEFNTLNNPNLTCIFVDDAAYSAANWTQIDATTSFVETQAECDQLAVEKNALIALYNSTDGPNWTDSTNWNTSAPVNEWFGVTVEGNQVVNITLTSNNLVGTLPAELGDLSGLQTLNLYDNQISGTIPIEIGNCTSLTYLSLANNLLSGSIPTELGNLLDIEILSLSNNQLTGTIPTEIGNLLDIELLSLSNNQITGVIPAEIGNCNKLTGLGLSNNQLSGSIPVEFANLTLITNLTLYANQLTGDIPDVFTNWTDLGQIHLETDFWGTFPNTNNFTGTLDLSNNVNLFACLIENTSISTLKLNNGNNTIINFLYAQNNPNLTCIFVDDAAYSTTNWTNIDTTATFVETQAECEALGLEDESLSQSITLYPNPTNGILNISSNNSITFKEVNVVNLYGQTVMESSFTETLDMSHLSNGVYFVNLVTQSNNKTTYKIIKQ